MYRRVGWLVAGIGFWVALSTGAGNWGLVGEFLERQLVTTARAQTSQTPTCTQYPQNAVGHFFYSFCSVGSSTQFQWTFSNLPDGVQQAPATPNSLSGYPTRAGPYTITINARTTNCTVAPCPLFTGSLTGFIQPFDVAQSNGLPFPPGSSLPPATVGQFYRYDFGVSGGRDGPRCWTATSQLQGLAINTSTGVLSGIPLSTGSFPIQLTVRGDCAPGSELPSRLATSTVNLTVMPATLPAPTIITLSPNSAVQLSPSIGLTINGTNFTNGATVLWIFNGDTSPLQNIQFFGPTQLTATIPDTFLTLAGQAEVVVLQNSGRSNSARFSIEPRVIPLTITNLNPNLATAGASQTDLTITGTGFVQNATVRWTPLGGQAVNLPSVQVNSATQITTQIPANLLSAAGTAQVSVANPTGSPSSSLTFTINAPASATISSLTPNTAVQGSPAISLTVNGTNFVSGAIVRWTFGGQTQPLQNTQFRSATQLTATIPPELLTAVGTAQVSVFQNNVQSPSSGFQITSVPSATVTNLNPSSATAGASQTGLTITGTGFLQNATVRWTPLGGPVVNLPSVVNSATQITAQIPANLLSAAGTAQVSVANPTGSPSSSLPFTINAPASATISTLSPNTAVQASPAISLTVNGTNFVSGAVVRWTFGGQTQALQNTQFRSAMQLTATIPPELLTAVGTAQVSVFQNNVQSPSSGFQITALSVGAVTLRPSATTSASDQPTVAITLPSAAVTSLTGTMRLSFTPNAPNLPAGYIDPTVRFANATGDGTTLAFTIPTGSTTATVPGEGRFSQGTVAGAISLTITALSAGGASVLPSPNPATTLTVARTSPVITPGSVRLVSITGTGFTVEVQGFSTSRDLSNASFTFLSASGSTLDGTTTFNVPISNSQASWFDTVPGRSNGSRFSLQVPFTFNGDANALGSVSVTLSNSVGTSSAVTGGR